MSHNINYITSISRHHHPNILPSIGQESNSAKQKVSSFLSDFFIIVFHHRFLPFNCCLSVVLSPDERDYPENMQTVSVS